ncbi:MAG: hypothetical protein N2439_09960 [Anaerolineae bacterium]|nr:hypothetical protein [Anaerolineae bacterium]
MGSLYLNERHRRRWERLRWAILGLLLAIGVIGYYGPWVPHKAAGLVVLGLDLAEYVKLLPDVIAGRVVLIRELFYLPLFAASASAALLAGRRNLPRWSRALLGLVSFPLAAAMLPPAWSPAVLLQPEFRLQVMAMIVCWLLVPAALITRYLPNRLILIMIFLLSLMAAIAPAWGFLQVHPGIEALYRRPLPPGWGFLVGTAGFLAAALFACAETLRRSV